MISIQQKIFKGYCRLLERNYFNNKVLNEYSVWVVLSDKIGTLFSYVALKHKIIICEEYLEFLNEAGIWH